MSKINVSLILFLLFPILLAAQQTLILQPDGLNGKDAFIHGLPSQQNLNFGNQAQLPAVYATFGGLPGVIRSLLYFDLSSLPTGATIVSAKLTLTAWGDASGIGFHSGINNGWLERVVTPWDESSVNWSNQPTTTQANRVEIPALANAFDAIEDLDITSLINDQFLNANSNFGMMLKLKDEAQLGKLNFNSSDAGNPVLRPKLVINYFDNSGIICRTIQPNGQKGKDAMLHGLSSQVNVNYGSLTQFTAAAATFGGLSGTIRSLIYFNLDTLEPNAVITSAKLSLYAWPLASGIGPHTGNNSAWLERVVAPWDENTVTWNTQPPTITQGRIAIPALAIPQPNLVNHDITGLIEKQWVAPDSAFGFMLRLQQEELVTKLNFYSSDHTEAFLRPRLDVCYTIQTSNKSLNTKPNFNLAPNPARQFINITSKKTNIQGFNITMIDATGRNIHSTFFSGSEGRLETIKLAPGIYRILVHEGSSVQSLTFVKE